MRTVWLIVCLALSGLMVKLSAEAIRVQPREVARFAKEIDESSALARHDGAIWTLNDSGNDPLLFQLDENGELQRSVRISNAENQDWESLAQDEDFLYIADTGNNFNSRDLFTIYRVPWRALSADSVQAETIVFRYADYESGNRLSHNFDAEALAVRGDELWLFTKNRGDGHSKLYRMPTEPGHYIVEHGQSLPVDALITAADIHPETGELILLGSRRHWLERESLLWLMPTSDAGVEWEQAVVQRLTPRDQWEAVVWDGTAGEVYLSHEDNARGYAGLARLRLNNLALPVISMQNSAAIGEADPGTFLH